MATDRYSDNHKIVVTNGTGTLTLDSDVGVTGDIAITGDMTFSGLVTGTVTTTEQIKLDVGANYIAAMSPSDFTSAFDVANAPSTGFLHFITYFGVTNDTLSFRKNISDRVPDGATINSIQLISYVTTGACDVTLTLAYQDHGSLTPHTMISILPKSNLTLIEDSSSGPVTEHTVDYSTRFYYINVELSATAGQLAYCAGVKITYNSRKFGQ